MAITFTNLGASTTTATNPDIRSNVDATSYSNSAWTPSTGLLIAFISTRTANTDATSPPVLPTITGNGLTWVNIKDVTYNLASSVNRGRLSLWAANNESGTATNGVTTFDYGSQTQTMCYVSFILANGVDLTGGVAAAFVQSPTNTGASVLSLDVTLAAESHADNRPIAGFAHSANELTTHRTNWTEADDMTAGSPVSALQTQWRSDAFETTASASWLTNSAAAGIAAELKALVAGGGGSIVHPVFANDDLHGVLFGGKVIR